MQKKKLSQDKPVKRAVDLTDRIFDRLVEAIVTREFPPSTTLREASIAKLWGVSRTPVRESVKKASLMGLVEIPDFRIFSSSCGHLFGFFSR